MCRRCCWENELTAQHITSSYSQSGVQPSSSHVFSATQEAIFVQSEDSRGQSSQEACTEPIRTGPETTVQCGGAVDDPARGMCEYHYNQYYPSKYVKDWDKGPTPHTSWAQPQGLEQPAIESGYPQKSWTDAFILCFFIQRTDSNATIEPSGPQSSRVEFPPSKRKNEDHQGQQAERQADKPRKPRCVMKSSSKPRRQPKRTITEGHCPQLIKRIFSPSDPRYFNPPSMRLQCCREIPIEDKYCGENTHNDKNWNIPQEQTWINPPEPGIPKTIFLEGHPKLFPRNQN
ncbi:hypothetical protein BOTNAR_0290g00190 [Botryotinia narcissicola]|uniref:Uncharacterized protein n=1 Tax=Botryotinia narcissicola TaxID=278944 RepID=A0A4Z1IAH7_9HELO|nr:hypothetical protein BOTNAR_0290g00190 [Botryotinia narcissicola]